MFGRILIFTLLFLGMTGLGHASQITVSGDVHGLWDTDTVLVIGDIRIPPDSHLTISAGVKVLFDGPFQMKVEPDAKIVAVGTPLQRVVFKPRHDGDTWRGIRMELCCGLSILDNCYFGHAALAGTGDSARGGAIYLHKSSLAIYHCTFESCSAADGGAICCNDNSNPLITTCFFMRNSAKFGGAICCNDSSRPLILGCGFHANVAELGGTAIYSDLSSPAISLNSFQHNRGGDGCIRVWGPDTTMQIENNSFVHDSSDAVIHISDMGPWSAELRYNAIVENVGVAIFAEIGSPVIERNAIIRNGAGLDLWYSASTVSCNRIEENKGPGINVYSDVSAIAASPTIEHNVIDRNLGGGISATGGNPIMRYNYVTRNRAKWYGGVRLDFCGAQLWHNTIAGNISDSAIGGIMNLDGVAAIKNSIVYGNLPESLQVLSYNFDWSVTADSCDIQGGWSYGTDNVDTDPQFRDAAHGDFYALSNAIITKPLPSCGNGIPDSMEIWIDAQATSIDDQSHSLPSDFILSQNYPNPFNPSTAITFSLPYRTHIRLEIFNALGQLVRLLCDSEIPSGKTSIIWDGKDNLQQSVASGPYLYRLITDDKTLTRKMLLLK